MSNASVVSEVSRGKLVVPRWLVPVGRAFYAIGLAGIGVQHFIFRNFIPVVVPYWPAWIPGRPLWVWVLGAGLIASGMAILFDVRARAAAALTGIVLARAVAVLLGLVLLTLVIFDDVPAVLRDSASHLGAWTNSFKALTLSGGAWVMAGSLEKGELSLPRWLRWVESVMPVGKYFLPITVAVFGVDHFLYPAFVATLVPKWVPGSAMFWTYFAAVALIASGVAMLVRVLPRLASLMLGIMIFLWVWMLHLPRALTMDASRDLGNEWTSVFEALAFSGIAFVLAALPKESRFSIAYRR
jgi:uncharacterized membrane protein